MSKIVNSIVKLFEGPRTVDFEFNRKFKEYQDCKERLIFIKETIEQYGAQLTGWQDTLNRINSFNMIFDREQKHYSQFMSNVVSAHKVLSQKLTDFCCNLVQLKAQTSQWEAQMVEIDSLSEIRKDKLKTYEHYDEKMGELMKDRNEIIGKGKKVPQEDEERIERNIGKLKKAAKEYIDISNKIYRNINLFLDARYENVSNTVVKMLEFEMQFAKEFAKIMNFFDDIKKKVDSIKNTLISQTNNDSYDAGNYIRGIELIGPFKSNNNNNNSINNNNNNNAYGNNYSFSEQNRGINNNIGDDKFNAQNNPYDVPYNNMNSYTKSNPYNSQSNNNPYNNSSNSSSNNPYSGNSGNNPYAGNNNSGNPYGGNNSCVNPFGDNNNSNNPYGGNNNNNNPYGGNNNINNPYGGNNNINNPYGGNNNNNNHYGGNDGNNNPYGGNDNSKNPYA